MKTRQRKLIICTGLTVSLVCLAVFLNRNDSSEKVQVDFKSSERKEHLSSKMDSLVEVPIHDRVNFDRKVIKRVTLPSSLPPKEEKTLNHILSYEDNGISARDRVKFLDENGIGFNDVESVYEFLQTERIPQNMSTQSYHWLTDELMGALRRSEVLRSKLSENLTSIVQNGSRDAMVRDYAMQHLGHLHEQGVDREEIEPTLWSGLDEVEASIAGTALLAINTAAENGNMIDKNELGVLASSIAEDEEYSLTSRITAMAVSGKNSNSQTINLARNVAMNPEASTVLRIAAVGALSPKDVSLQELRYSSNRRIRRAVSLVLRGQK